MPQSFRDFKKQLQQKKEQDEMFRELDAAIAKLKKRRDEYVKKAKEALKSGNKSQAAVYASLLKNTIYYIDQAQDMVANLTVARDMYEMQQLNKHFVHSIDSVMKNVYKTCKAIHVADSEEKFQRALYAQAQTSTELRDALKNNNMMFTSTVDSVADISDDEVKELLDLDEEKDKDNIDDALSMLEKEFSVGKAKQDKPAPVLETVAPAAPVSAPEPEKPVEPRRVFTPQPEAPKEKGDKPSPEDKIMNGISEGANDFTFRWDDIPTVCFDDIAGLEEVKETVQVKVLLPLKNPEAFEGYEKKNGGGLCLYGPPGTGKTMIAAAIANEIHAKFCSVKPSDLLFQGMGQSEKAIRSLFAQARKYPCAVIYFDEMDSISPKETRSTYARQLRSEFLSQLQGVESYGEKNQNILFLIAATNKPWDIDSAFLRPGRFGTRIYVGLPDDKAREYMVCKRLEKIDAKGKVHVDDDIDISAIVEKTNGFNGSDITNLLDRVEELSILRSIRGGEKTIGNSDFEKALGEIHSSVQSDDLVKLKEWKENNIH